MINSPVNRAFLSFPSESITVNLQPSSIEYGGTQTTFFAESR